MASFLGRLKTFMLCTFFIAIVAIIAMFYYSLRYSYSSSLEINYLGTFKFGKDFREWASKYAVAANLSHASSWRQLSDVNLLPVRLPSNYSDQKFKTKVSEIKNNYYDESISNNGSDARPYRHEHSNRSSINAEQNGIANNRSNQTHFEDENLCPKNLSTLGKP